MHPGTLNANSSPRAAAFCEDPTTSATKSWQMAGSATPTSSTIMTGYHGLSVEPAGAAGMLSPSGNSLSVFNTVGATTKTAPPLLTVTTNTTTTTTTTSTTNTTTTGLEDAKKTTPTAPLGDSTKAGADSLLGILQSSKAVLAATVIDDVFLDPGEQASEVNGVVRKLLRRPRLLPALRAALASVPLGCEPPTVIIERKSFGYYSSSGSGYKNNGILRSTSSGKNKSIIATFTTKSTTGRGGGNNGRENNSSCHGQSEGSSNFSSANKTTSAEKVPQSNDSGCRATGSDSEMLQLASEVLCSLAHLATVADITQLTQAPGILSLTCSLLKSRRSDLSNPTITNLLEYVHCVALGGGSVSLLESGGNVIFEMVQDPCTHPSHKRIITFILLTIIVDAEFVGLARRQAQIGLHHCLRLTEAAYASFIEYCRISRVPYLRAFIRELALLEELNVDPQHRLGSSYALDLMMSSSNLSGQTYVGQTDGIDAHSSKSGAELINFVSSQPMFGENFSRSPTRMIQFNNTAVAATSAINSSSSSSSSITPTTTVTAAATATATSTTSSSTSSTSTNNNNQSSIDGRNHNSTNSKNSRNTSSLPLSSLNCARNSDSNEIHTAPKTSSAQCSCVITIHDQEQTANHYSHNGCVSCLSKTVPEAFVTRHGIPNKIPGKYTEAHFNICEACGNGEYSNCRGHIEDNLSTSSCSAALPGVRNSLTFHHPSDDEGDAQRGSSSPFLHFDHHRVCHIKHHCNSPSLSHSSASSRHHSLSSRSTYTDIVEHHEVESCNNSKDLPKNLLLEVERQKDSTILFIKDHAITTCHAPSVDESNPVDEQTKCKYFCQSSRKNDTKAQDGKSENANICALVWKCFVQIIGPHCSNYSQHTQVEVSTKQ